MLRLNKVRMDGDSAASSSKDTDVAQQPVHFADHELTQERVEDKVHKQNIPVHPPTAVGKSAELATAGVKHGTEELLEVLTTPQGRRFVRAMAISVVQGYLEVAQTAEFKQAAREGAAAGFEGTMQVTERWMQSYKMEAAKLVDPRSLPGQPLLRWAGVYLAAMAVALLLLMLSALLLVWKAILSSAT